MPKRKTTKSGNETTDKKSAEAARERELREMIQRVEDVKESTTPPKKESPHDFVEKKMREEPKK